MALIDHRHDILLCDVAVVIRQVHPKGLKHQGRNQRNQACQGQKYPREKEHNRKHMVSPLLRLLGRQTFRYDDAEADDQHQDKYGDQGQNPRPLPPGRIPVPRRTRHRHQPGRLCPGQHLSQKEPALHHTNHGRKDCRSYNHTHQMGSDLDGMDKPHGTVHYL